MSDVMLLGVLRMPVNEDNPLCMAHFISRAREAADRIESDAAEITRLQAENEALRAKADLFRRACEDLLDERPLEQAFILRKQAEAVRSLNFPVVLRKMWSGGSVREWLDKEAQRLRTQAAALERQSEGGDKS